MRAYESMEEKPSIETTKNAFKIILPNINAKYETGKFSAPKAEAITSSAAGAEKKLSNEEKVLKYARFHGTITRNDVIELLEVSTSTASRVIRRMVKSNLLKQNGKVRYIFALLRILAMCSKDFCEVAEMNETENKSERTDLFLEKLKKDSPRYSGLETTGYSLAEKKNTIRSLMNIRMPGALSDELVNLQDEYLQEERKAKGVVVLADIPTVREQFNSGFPHADKISIWQGDITRLKAGAVVNAANSQMLGCFVPCHRCIDNAIHSAAGMQLREECAHIMSPKRAKNWTGF